MPSFNVGTFTRWKNFCATMDDNHVKCMPWPDQASKHKLWCHDLTSHTQHSGVSPGMVRDSSTVAYLYWWRRSTRLAFGHFTATGKCQGRLHLFPKHYKCLMMEICEPRVSRIKLPKYITISPFNPLPNMWNGWCPIACHQSFQCEECIFHKIPCSERNSVFFHNRKIPRWSFPPLQGGIDDLREQWRNATNNALSWELETCACITAFSYGRKGSIHKLGYLRWLSFVSDFWNLASLQSPQKTSVKNALDSRHGRFAFLFVPRVLTQQCVVQGFSFH